MSKELEKDNLYLKIAQQYNKRLAESIKSFKALKLSNKTISTLEDWLNDNEIDIKVKNYDFEIKERFISPSESTWSKIEEIVVHVYGNVDWIEPYEYLVVRIKEVLSMIYDGVVDSAKQIAEELERDFKYKKGLDATRISNALVIESLTFKYVQRAYLDLVNTIYKSVIKYFLNTKDFDPINISPEQHYARCLSIFKNKIELKSERFEREFASWVYDWDNTEAVVSEYIDTNDALEYAKVFGKTFAGDFI